MSLPRTGTALSLVAALSLGCDESSTAPVPDATVDRGLIVFAAEQVFWKVEPDGSVLKAIGRDGQDPMLSPDLTRIGFTKDGRPALSRLDGSGLQFFDDDWAPLVGWMDDGTFLLQRSDSLFARVLSTSEDRVVYAVDDRSDAWITGSSLSWDGRRLVVATFDTLEDEAVVSMVDTDGAGVPDTVIRLRGSFVFPRSSPDGRRIALERYPVNSSIPLAIRIIDVESGAIHDVRPAETGQHFRFPVWTPDGDSLLVNRYRVGAQSTDLVVVAIADGSTRVLLEGIRGMHWPPDWRAIP